MPRTSTGAVTIVSVVIVAGVVVGSVGPVVPGSAPPVRGDIVR